MRKNFVILKCINARIRAQEKSRCLSYIELLVAAACRKYTQYAELLEIKITSGEFHCAFSYTLLDQC